ncbi:hypothetical protein GW17_00052003, partial [Ensete ventricosum]
LLLTVAVASNRSTLPPCHCRWPPSSSPPLLAALPLLSLAQDPVAHRTPLLPCFLFLAGPRSSSDLAARRTPLLPYFLFLNSSKDPRSQPTLLPSSPTVTLAVVAPTAPCFLLCRCCRCHLLPIANRHYARFKASEICIKDRLQELLCEFRGSRSEKYDHWQDTRYPRKREEFLRWEDGDPIG